MGRPLATQRNPRRIVRNPAAGEIWKLLKDHQLTVTALASEIQQSRQYLSAVINGKVRVSETSAVPKKIADYFGVPVDSLFPRGEFHRIDTAA